MSLADAINVAYNEGLDLVEIVPTADPPVCEIMDYGKYRFDQKKKDKEQRTKQKTVAAKAVRLRPVSSDHDVNIKIEQIKRFLEEKRVVSVNIRFKNRELAHRENGRKIIERIIQAVESVGKAEGFPRFEGHTLSVRFSPK